MAVVLTVVVPDYQTFRTYDYGYGVVREAIDLPNGKVEVVVDYGDDQYHADYQAGRFWSGLHPARVEYEDEYEDETPICDCHW